MLHPFNSAAVGKLDACNRTVSQLSCPDTAVSKGEINFVLIDRSIRQRIDAVFNQIGNGDLLCCARADVGDGQDIGILSRTRCHCGQVCNPKICHDVRLELLALSLVGLL